MGTGHAQFCMSRKSPSTAEHTETNEFAAVREAPDGSGTTLLVGDDVASMPPLLGAAVAREGLREGVPGAYGLTVGGDETGPLEGPLVALEGERDGVPGVYGPTVGAGRGPLLGAPSPIGGLVGVLVLGLRVGPVGAAEGGMLGKEVDGSLLGGEVEGLRLGVPGV